MSSLFWVLNRSIKFSRCTPILSCLTRPRWVRSWLIYSPNPFIFFFLSIATFFFLASPFICNREKPDYCMSGHYKALFYTFYTSLIIFVYHELFVHYVYPLLISWNILADPGEYSGTRESQNRVKEQRPFRLSLAPTGIAWIKTGLLFVRINKTEMEISPLVWRTFVHTFITRITSWDNQQVCNIIYSHHVHNRISYDIAKRNYGVRVRPRDYFVCIISRKVVRSSL